MASVAVSDSVAVAVEDADSVAVAVEASVEASVFVLLLSRLPLFQDRLSPCLWPLCRFPLHLFPLG